jgi:nitrite reductase/ring-hydroxylating ferredoxin subunit
MPHRNTRNDQLFCWEKNWWPAIPVSYLDPSRPTALELLGKPFVVWRDREGRWKCFGDECPHRLAPLSGAHGQLGILVVSMQAFALTECTILCTTELYAWILFLLWYKNASDNHMHLN